MLDRPNPAGRPIEGTLLQPGQESFVGAGPMPMRHGLTLGEMGHMTVETVKAIGTLPVKVFDVAQAIVGVEDRAQDASADEEEETFR